MAGANYLVVNLKTENKVHAGFCKNYIKDFRVDFTDSGLYL